MTAVPPPKSPSSRRVLLTAGVFLGYLLTVSIDTALQRHIADAGRLQWIGSIPGCALLLDAYILPARLLARVPGVNAVLEFSESLWWRLLDPPDTTA